MNNLTWALYGVEVLNSFNSLTVVLFLIAIVVFVVCLVSAGMRADNNSSYGDDRKEFGDYFKIHWSYARGFVVTSSILLCLSIFIPSKDTMYLMLSSEIAGKMTESKEFKNLYSKSFELVNSKIDDALKNIAKEKK